MDSDILGLLILVLGLVFWRWLRLEPRDGATWGGLAALSFLASRALEVGMIVNADPRDVTDWAGISHLVQVIGWGLLVVAAARASGALNRPAEPTDPEVEEYIDEIRAEARRKRKERLQRQFEGESE